MRVTNFGRKKDTLRMAGMFLIIFFVLTFNFFITTAAQGDQAELIQRLLTDPEGLVKYVTGIYPPALWVTRALSSTGIPAFFNLLYFLALSATTLLLFGLAGSRYFYRGLIGGEEVARGPKISEEALGKRLSRSTSPVYAIALREIKLLFRTPIYLFNSVALLLIIPVVLLIPALTGGGGIGQIVEMAFATGNRAALVLVAGAFMGGMALFTPAASSSFSREGKLFWISQVIPMSPREQIRGKILYSLMIAWLAVPLVVLFSIRTVPLTFSELVIAVLLGTALSFPAITISLLIDLLRPYLDWDNPQKPIKQNVNVLLAMVAGAGLFYAIYFLTRQVMAVGVGSFGLYLTVLLLSLVTGLIPYSILIKIADSRYRDIQV
jgi:ABC-2 type transport system permease protein